jgi:BASS family bile acid:Na+ symporter
LVVFVMASMFSAGLTTTFANLWSAVSRVWLVLMVLGLALVVRPLLGWGLAELFNLNDADYIAMVLLASVAGAPLAVKWVMNAKADVVSGATFQVLIAVVATFTFAPTANGILEVADIGEGVSLPVGDLVKTIVFLQIIPFVVGILIRHSNEKRALEWNGFALKVIGPSFMAVIVLALLGSWQSLIDLVGSRALAAAAVFSVVMIVAGYVFSQGGRKTRTATALIAPGSNSGPAFVAVGIAFDNDALILAAVTGMVFIQIVVGTLAGSFFARGIEDDSESSDAGTGAAETPAPTGEMGSNG